MKFSGKTWNEKWIGSRKSCQTEAELALKYAYETENPTAVAPQTRKLYDELYSKLSDDRRDSVKAAYAGRIQRHRSNPDDGWKTAKQVFQSANDYFEKWRDTTEEDSVIPDSNPVFLREAIGSVLKTLNVNVSLSEASK